MFKPKYLTRLSKNNFSLNDFACQGEQLGDILNFIKNLLPPHIWFGSDIWTNSNRYLNDNFESFKLKEIGDLTTLICLASQTSQFMNGIFVAIKKEETFLEASFDLELGTENEEFRIIDLTGIIIEIRAFDTSYFEIYTENLDLIQKIASHYGTAILSLERSN